MSATATEPRRTPALSGIRMAREMIFRGISIESQVVRSVADPEVDIVRWRAGRRLVFVVANPEYVDHLLHENADGYHKSMEYELLRTVLGLNLFTDEDESWRHFRMLLNPVMAKRHVREMGDLMIDPVERFLAGFDDGGERIELEMAGAMTELTLDVVGAALFGHRFGDIARQMRRVVTSGLRSAEVATRLMMVAAPPVWLTRAFAAAIHHSPYMPPPLDRVQWVMRTVDEAVWGLIDERRANPSETGDLLNLLLEVEDENGKLPLRRVRDEATTFMLAGHETTANALSWMWYLLALNTEARDRMLEEVDTVLGGRRPSVEDLEKLPWTTACVEESLRYFSPAWAIPRVAIRDDEIDGHRIPRGATVIVPVHAIHHDPRLWPEPEVYDPSRFLPENARGRHRSAYLPFGGGRRICIGMSFALLESTLIAAMLSQSFVFDLVPGHPVEPEATLTRRPRRGIRMVARRRDGAVAPSEPPGAVSRPGSP
jgi:cytochrome P450